MASIYAAAGLVWRRHGEAAVRALLAPCGAADLAGAVAACRRRVPSHTYAGDRGGAGTKQSVSQHVQPLRSLA